MKLLLVALFIRFLLLAQAKVECEAGAEPVQSLTDGSWRCKKTLIACRGGPTRVYHKTAVRWTEIERGGRLKFCI